MVAYFQVPDAELALIDMDSFDTENVDWITMYALKNNADTISSFVGYDEDVESNGDKSKVSLSDSSRNAAKRDALGLIRDWKSLSRFNQ